MSECPLCGQEKEQLAQHIRKMHNVTDIGLSYPDPDHEL